MSTVWELPEQAAPLMMVRRKTIGLQQMIRKVHRRGIQIIGPNLSE